VVGIAEHPVITAHNRVAAANFGIGKRTAKGYKAPANPGRKKNRGVDGRLRRGGRRAEYPHAYYQAHHNHRKVEQVQFLLGTHGMASCMLVGLKLENKDNCGIELEKWKFDKVNIFFM